jgi:hypothetical protein
MTQQGQFALSLSSEGQACWAAGMICFCWLSELQQCKRMLSVAEGWAKAVQAHQGLLLTDTTM